MKDLLTRYTRYNLWANTKIFEMIGKAGEAALDKELVSSFPTIRKTLYHIRGAETIWLLRLQGASPAVWPDDRPLSLTELKELSLAASKKFSEFVASKEEEWFLSSCKYSALNKTQYENKVCDIVHHCMNHSTYHRGQIITMLRNAGAQELASTDFITYARL
jgi:uncharacterized damage-inducible protein DinB